MTVLAVPAAAGGSLRQRLIDDMTLRRFSRETQRNYIRDVGRLAAFLRRSPDTATGDDLRRFQIAQQELGLGVPTMNAIVSALRFFFVQTLNRPRSRPQAGPPSASPRAARRAERRRGRAPARCHGLPEAPSPPCRLPTAPDCAWPKSPRSGSAISTRPALLLRIERGKGERDRNALLSADLLDLLRRWWVEGYRQGVPAAPGLAVPRAGPDTADQHAPASPHRRGGGARGRDLQSASVPIPCAIPSPPISWRMASTSASSRSCSGTAGSTRPPSTPRSPPGRCGP